MKNNRVTIHHSKEKIENKDELEFYKSRYMDMLNLQNEKHRSARNYSRIKTIENFYNSKKYCPTDEVIQYGHFGNKNLKKEDFEKMINEFVDWKINWSKNHGNHLHILNFSINFDKTPHGHIRQIWDYKDSDGIIKIGQEKAMKQSGLKLPNPKEPESRFNNRSITFTKICREKWIDICEKYGYEVEKDPLPNKKQHETIQQYRNRLDQEYIQKRVQHYINRYNVLQKTLDNRLEELNSLESKLYEKEVGLYEREQELKKKIGDFKKKKADFNDHVKKHNELVNNFTDYRQKKMKTINKAKKEQDEYEQKYEQSYIDGMNDFFEYIRTNEDPDMCDWWNSAFERYCNYKKSLSD